MNEQDRLRFLLYAVGQAADRVEHSRIEENRQRQRGDHPGANATARLRRLVYAPHLEERRQALKDCRINLGLAHPALTRRTSTPNRRVAGAA